MRSPLELVITRTRPIAVPAITLSPVLRVPFWTKMVATGPRPLSSFASITVPFAIRSGFALSSFTSATSWMFSRRSWIPILVLAETGTQITSPPHSSGTSSYSVSSCFTFSGSAVGLSILLIATMMETPAAFAWLIDSTVCGMIPSSAATTRTAISVISAPRARIEVNASCPGVSRKVIGLSFTITWYAPMCWVIPPASVEVTSEWRIASRMDVLPWSTWPITTTTGGRSTFLSSSSSLSSNRRSSMVTTTSFSTFAPISIATSAAVS